jgi:hypothetical protein
MRLESLWARAGKELNGSVAEKCGDLRWKRSTKNQMHKF